MSNRSRIDLLASQEVATQDPPIVAVGGVVYRRDKRGQVRLLLIKKRNGFWTLPKGRVKPGEDATAHYHSRSSTGARGSSLTCQSPSSEGSSARRSPPALCSRISTDRAVGM
jgi:8-oxo-dGTP pyrophosphatase MutT (NUDIX family)